MTNARHQRWRVLLVAVMSLLTAITGLSQFAEPGDQPLVKVSTYWSDTGVKPGAEITLGVVLDIRPPYHINSDKARSPFIPTKVELVDVPEDVRASTAMFPDAGELDFDGGLGKQRIRVFSKRLAVCVPLSVTASARPGERVLKVKISYQACDEKQCLLPAELVEICKFSVVDRSVDVKKINEPLFAAMRETRQRLDVAFFGLDFKFDASNFALLLLVAAVGGLLLNFTPCVLPVIPIKIMGLANAAGNRSRCLALGFAMTFGVVAFWLGLAAAISTISGFNATNKLFQYPAFTITVGIVICAMAVGMCGFFAVRLPEWVYRVNPTQESFAGSFGFGVMTSVLSTPCTAPFMGAAAAWSATQRPVITLVTFLAIGLGMGLPYLILSAFPALTKRMPRTGPASELIKQVMGLLMLAAGAYFLGTGLAGALAQPPDPPSQVYWWAVALFVAAAGFWTVWRTFHITNRLRNRLVFGAVGVGLIGVALASGFRFTQVSPIHWIYYTPQRLLEARRQDKIVILEFTAAWCLNCHLLEQAVLHDAQVVKLMNSTNVAPIKVDLTGHNTAGDQKLIEVGRRTIPYLLVYSRGGKQVFASDAYTIEQLVNAIGQAQAMN